MIRLETNIEQSDSSIRTEKVQESGLFNRNIFRLFDLRFFFLLWKIDLKYAVLKLGSDLVFMEFLADIETDVYKRQVCDKDKMADAVKDVLR